MPKGSFTVRAALNQSQQFAKECAEADADSAALLQWGQARKRGYAVIGTASKTQITHLSGELNGRSGGGRLTG